MHDGMYYHALSKYYPLYVNKRRSMTQAIMFGLATFKLLFVKFDVIDVDSIPFFPLFSARIVTWIKGKKMHATWHEVWGRKYWLEYLKGPAGYVGYIIERLAFLMPDVVTSNSLSTTERLRQAGLKKEIITIPLGVDLAKIYNAGLVDSKSDIIFVGRLLAHKNVDLLIKAISIVKEMRPGIICKIIGTGPEKDNLNLLIEQSRLTDNVHISEVEDNNCLFGMMKASKMLVLPSVREGFGLVVIEANAAGLPVITTSHEDNAAKDLIMDGINGLLVKPDEKSIAEGILKTFEKLETMEPRKGIDKYDWINVMQKVRIALF